MSHELPTPIERLPNLGLTSARILRSVGVGTVEELERIGPVAAYVRARHAWEGATLNLLWGMVAGLRGVPWTDLEPSEKTALRAQADAYVLHEDAAVGAGSNLTRGTGSARVRVYIASSLDGFIAGPGDDLSWLPGPETGHDGDASHPGALGYEDFIADVGALLIGRGTFDVVHAMESWGYRELPVLVATTRVLPPDVRSTVRAVSGDIRELVGQAKGAAGGKDVYLDGGSLIRQAAEADLIDDLTITFAPVALGAGHPLFAGLTRRYRLEITGQHAFAGGMVQIRARPRRG